MPQSPAELHGVTLKDRNLSADHLEVFHTHRFDPTPAPTKSRSVGIASAIVVLSLTNSRSVISNCLSNYFASTFCCSTAVRNGLLNASVSLSRNSASLRTRSNLPSDMAALLALLRGQEMTSVTPRL